MSDLAPEAVPATPAPAPSAPEGGFTLNVSHVAGGGVGTLVGAVIVALLNRFGNIHLSDADSALVGSAALSAGVGFAHVGGLFGLVNAFLHGARA